MALRLTHSEMEHYASREFLAEAIGMLAVIVALIGLPLSYVAPVPILAMMLGAVAVAVMPNDSPDEALSRRARREEYLAVAFGLIAILLGFLELIFGASLSGMNL